VTQKCKWKSLNILKVTTVSRVSNIMHGSMLESKTMMKTVSVFYVSMAKVTQQPTKTCVGTFKNSKTDMAFRA